MAFHIQIVSEKAKNWTKNGQKPSKKGGFSSPSDQLTEFIRKRTFFGYPQRPSSIVNRPGHSLWVNWCLMKWWTDKLMTHWWMIKWYTERCLVVHELFLQPTEFNNMMFPSARVTHLWLCCCLLWGWYNRKISQEHSFECSWIQIAN